MKILTELIPKDENEEIIFKVHEVTDEILELIARVEQSSKQELVAFLGKQIHLVNIQDIFYIESVDKRTFLYTKDEVFESRERLYQLEEMLENTAFIRVSKSTLLSWRKISMFVPTLYGKFEAELENGERIAISRKYAPNLKKALGIGGNKK